MLARSKLRNFPKSWFYRLVTNFISMLRIILSAILGRHLIRFVFKKPYVTGRQLHTYLENDILHFPVSRTAAAV